MINVFQPALGEEELSAIKEVFESNWIGKGKKTASFEEGFANHLGTDKGLVRTINSCTEGLFQSMPLLNIGQGDEVIIPTIHFIGAGNAIAACGAKPVFCDVESRSLNTTAKLLEEKITKKTKAILLLHYGGIPCEMDEILPLVKENKLLLIEDSGCAVASKYKGKACGTFGDVAVWSFDAMKILVMGDGGMVYCKTPELANKLEKLAYLGLESESGLTSKVDQKWWEFDVSSFSRRSIINDISGAIACVQLGKLPSFIEKRRQIHNFYSKMLAHLSWLETPPAIPDDISSSYYFYWIQTKPALRDKLAKFLRENGIYTTYRYYPLHWVKYYQSKAVLPGAEKAANSTLCLPIHQSLSIEDLGQIVSKIYEFGKLV